MDDRELPEGWTMWHERPGDVCVLAYRPDVFDGSDLPPACLPILTIKPQRTRGGRGRPRPASAGGPWCAECALEPDVIVERRTASSRAEAVTAGLEMAEQLADGTIDVRSVHPDPNAPYVDRLEALLDGRCEE